MYRLGLLWDLKMIYVKCSACNQPSIKVSSFSARYINSSRWRAHLYLAFMSI